MLDLGVDGFLAAFVRAGAWVFTAPVTSSPSVPPRVRAGLSIYLALILAPLRDPAGSDLLATLPAEALFGLIAGFSARVALAGIEAAGQLLGLLLGVGFASFFDPNSGEQSLPTRRIAFSLAAIAYLAVGGIDDAIRLLAAAPSPPPGLGHAIAAVLGQGGEVFVASVRAAAPLLLAAVVTNLTAAFASRAAPALNPFSVMLALFLIVGLGVLLASAPAWVFEVFRAAERSAALPADLLHAR
ncbi:MAG: flagellar biosynthetic protein FliR [Deltaproteobacteria bacterium]|nr:flagellar biosynthetic protein FliR [Deltaproteobacteria bacterium]